MNYYLIIFLIIVSIIIFLFNCSPSVFLIQLKNKKLLKQNLEYTHIYEKISVNLNNYTKLSFILYLIIVPISAILYVQKDSIPILILLIICVILININKKIININKTSIETIDKIKQKDKLLYIFNECCNPDLKIYNNICFGENILFIKNSGLIFEYKNISQCLVSKKYNYLLIKINGKILIKKHFSNKNFNNIEYYLFAKKINFKTI